MIEGCSDADPRLSDDRKADLLHLRFKRLDASIDLHAWNRFLLSSVPPVNPRPRPDILAMRTPQQAMSGTGISDVASPRRPSNACPP